MKVLRGVIGPALDLPQGLTGLPLAAKYTENPSPELVAADMGVTLAEVNRALPVQEQVVSADAPVSRDSRNPLLGCLPDRQP